MQGRGCDDYHFRADLARLFASVLSVRRLAGQEDEVKSAVAIVIDGVLRKADHQPIPEGIRLYRMLVQQVNLVLFADDFQDSYREGVEHFIHTEKLSGHSKLVLPNPVAHDYIDARVMQANHARNAGLALDYIVEPEADAAQALVDEGFNVMHFLHAQYSRPDWRPTFQRTLTPWAEIAGEAA